MQDREWMYTGHPSVKEMTPEWISKTDEFLELAFRRIEPAILAFCPCRCCENTKKQDKDTMGKHLVKYGFKENYHRWTHHGEADRGERVRDEAVRRRIEAADDEAGFGDMLNDYDEAQPEEPEPTAKAYYDMMGAAQKPLHEHTKVSQLDSIARLMAVKSQFSLSRDCFDTFLTVIGGLLPGGHILPKNMYESQKVLRALKMPYEQIHCCPNGCVLFRKEHAQEKYCPKCKASRFVEVDHGDGGKRQLTIAVNILRYLPFIPRIQRLYMTEETAKQMTWHKHGRRYNPDKLVHPSDADAWKHFDACFPEKANEARNVRVALATDGFNPYGMAAAPYTCWPVFVIPLNLPPGVLFQRQYIFLSLIIPGHPGNNMSVYMQPLIDDLEHAWEEGVRTYDRATQTNFTMHIWFQYSMHDLPAYGLLSGWCVHGKFPCPVCKARLRFLWLTKGGKYVAFDKHRQFLPLNHPFRRDRKNFTKGVTVRDAPPHMMTGADISAELDGLQVNVTEGGFVGYGELHAWTQKSGLWKLSYMKILLIAHYIDVMHTEKNIAEALFCTCMDIPEKTKDNVKARVDQAELCDRPKLNMTPPGSGKSWRKPKADFVLTRAQRREVLEWFKTLMFPDGYAANLRRGVNLSTMRINGLKSHDYHIWLERILPVMLRGYVPEHVWLVLAELSYFFRQLCAKEVLKTVIEEMEAMAPVLLCKLEKIFPPGFFNPMQHMILHLPHEARMGGPVQNRWCYSIERCQKVLRTKCKNKAKIEASIAEAYILEEVSNFTTKYYSENLPNLHNPTPRYNSGEVDTNLSLFRGQLGTASEGRPKTLTPQEWRSIMLYVLTNLDEVQPYIRNFVDQFWHRTSPPTEHEIDTLLRQGAGNKSLDFMSWFKQKAQTDVSMSAELRQVANGCHYRVMSFTSYDVNGYRFRTTGHERTMSNRRTTNTGVCTPGLDGLEYYGIIDEIYELDFDGCKPLNPVIFKCHWFDPSVLRRTPNIGLVEIRQSSVLPGDDVYIVGQQAIQVYYIDYPCKNARNLQGWSVVYKVSPHGKLPVPNNEDYNIDPNTYAGEFFQESGLEGRFEIDLTEAVGMELDDQMTIEEDIADVVQNVKDLQLLERLRLGNDTEDDIPPPLEGGHEDLEMQDSDDETNDAGNPDLDDYF